MAWLKNKTWRGASSRWLARLVPPPGDLLRDAVYRRLWASIAISSLGGQVTMLALPLTAALLLHASPTQMGLLTAMEIVPFVLLSLPAGVWLDRVRKLPVVVGGEWALAAAVAAVPVAWSLGWLTMGWLYVTAAVIGAVYTVAGSASQVVLTQIVPRARLVEAHAKNALATSGAEVAGPGLAGALIKVVGAPMALLVDAVMLIFSALILRGLRVDERVQAASAQGFLHEMKVGLRFVAGHRLLVALAIAVGTWQMCNQAAVVVQILFATRTLGMSESMLGLAFVGMGVGTVLSSLVGDRISRRLGPGPALALGFGLCGAGWLQGSLAPAGPWGIAMFAGMLFFCALGGVQIYINFLSLRQAVTPAPLLGRMTSTIRWLILIPAGPGALIGGWLGEHLSLRAGLAFAGGAALLLALAAARHPAIRDVRQLPKPADEPAAPVLAPAA